MNPAEPPPNPHENYDADSKPAPKSRVKHSTLPAGMVLAKVGRHHFAFFKAWLEGLDMKAMAQRYLEPVDGTRLHERTIREIVNWIRRDLVALAKRNGKFAYARAISINPEQLASDEATPTLDEFRSERDPHEMYSETELLELFMDAFPSGEASRKNVRNIRLREKQAAALSWLEGQVNTDPHLNDPVSAWLVPNLTHHLQTAGISTLRELVYTINTSGQRWYTRIPNIGEASAKRIMRWLVAHEQALRVRIGMHALVKYSELDVQMVARTRQRTCGIVPIEFFEPMHGLDGSNGINRGERNKTGAHNDYEAIHLWLRTSQEGSNTWRSYRKEAERFLMWSILERGKPLSSMLVDDCIAYRDFLNDLGRIPAKVWDLKYRIPQENWLGKRGTERWSEAWRPFERPPVDRYHDANRQASLLAGTSDNIIYLKPVLSLASQKLAQTILKTMCEWLSRQRYLDSNPWDGVPPLLKESPKVQTGRSFTFHQWELLLQYAESQEYNAKYARLLFILKLGYGTGMRLSEMTAAVMGDLRPYESPATGIRGWELVVIGKGQRERMVVMPSGVIEELRRYMAHRGYTSHAEIPPDAPLIDRMVKAPSSAGSSTLGTPPSELATLSDQAVYQALKQFFKEAADAIQADFPEEARRIRKGSTHWLRHTSGTHAVAKGIPIEVVQGNFGHASVNTTSIYVTAETDRRMQEMEKLM